MKKLIYFLLIIFLLSSCELSNVYQKLGIAQKESLRITPAVTKSEIVDGKTDIVRGMLGNDLFIQCNVSVPQDFSGYMLRSQTKEELEALTIMINAKCYTDEEIDAFLNEKLSDEESILALKGMAALLKDSKDKIVNSIKELLPIASLEGELSDSEKNLREQYNKLVDSINKLLDEAAEKLFNPIINMLNSESLTNGDLIRCQLTVNLIDGLISSINDICVYVVKQTSSISFENIDISNITSTQLDQMVAEIERELEETAKVSISVLLRHLLSPIACLDRITFNNEDEVGLPSFDTIYTLLSEVNV
ncbi:hypothetical protein [Bullifex porci]|uniref:hypothetical protein n=1 Tax=Bullifex porci TaxID=2606638 RepID=UPI0023F214C2|nr:hypothetical protein [Bullifex porci]MDD7255330.1 hypothetical protein [Bullifex porci]MDY2740693.1 hypothetical protein [Bullifex porci]